MVLSKILHADIVTVFNAWTRADQLNQWWGPYGFTNPVCVLDPRPGGIIHIEMTSPDGMVFPMEGVFQKIDPPMQLIFTSSAFEDLETGNKFENLNMVSFEEVEARTRLILEDTVLSSTPEMDIALDGMKESWRQSLDKLSEYLIHQ
jgi:uncharacterized protein YndB with AHSA1/START domain